MTVLEDFIETIIELKKRKDERYTCIVYHRAKNRRKKKWKKYKRIISSSWKHKGTISFSQAISISLGYKGEVPKFGSTMKWWEHPKRKEALELAHTLINGGKQIEAITINIFDDCSDIVVAFEKVKNEN